MVLRPGCAGSVVVLRAIGEEKLERRHVLRYREMWDLVEVTGCGGPQPDDPLVYEGVKRVVGAPTDRWGRVWNGAGGHVSIQRSKTWPSGSRITRTSGCGWYSSTVAPSETA